MWHFVVKINSLKVVRPSRIIFVKHNCSYDYHSLIFSSEDILKQLCAAFERIRCLNRNKTGHKEKRLHFYSNILYKSLNQLRKSLPVQVVVTSAHTHTHTHTHTADIYSHQHLYLTEPCCVLRLPPSGQMWQWWCNFPPHFRTDLQTTRR